jgi:quercetin dioxygenase-like cupin family protein
MENPIEFPKAQAFNFNTEVDYNDGAIVSKSVLRKPAGNVSLFAFDKGEGLSEHSAPFDAMVLVIDGKAEIIIGGESHYLSQDETIIMPANIPHALRATERFKMVLVMIK